MHTTFMVDVYRQPMVFIVDSHLTRGRRYLESVTHHPVHLPHVLDDPYVLAAAFILDHDTGPTFVVWLKSFNESPNDVARLGHEVMHATIHLLTYLGYSPRLSPRHSEPICYLFDTIFRTCLEHLHR